MISVKFLCRRKPLPLWAVVVFTLALLTSPSVAQQPPVNREFPLGSLRVLDQLPLGRFRTQLEQLPDTARGRALQWLRSMHFTEQDLASLHADRDGGVFYVCETLMTTEEPPAMEPSPDIGQAAVPVSPFPAALSFHSRPGSANVLFLNFAGENVIDTAWNDQLNRAEIPAMPFSSDLDYSTYSDSEQVAIKRIWQRMAEDYAPFDLDVTTERPAAFNSRTAMALITRKTDANGNPNPYNTGGGVAYMNAFGTSTYANYRPAWVYHDNLSHSESYVAEAASHEIGHNLGLSHDGKTDGSEYYGGHGSGDTSWGPLMGTGYNRNVSQWCQGEYYLANNTQDDLAAIAGKVAYRADDHGSTTASATTIQISGGTNIVSTTPENDPTNANPRNKGVLERNTDRDVFSFITGTGPVRLAVDPWVTPSGTRGGNVDLLLELFNESGTLLQTSNPAAQTTALIQTDLTAGRYFLHVRNSAAGDPFSSTPTGYTLYGSMGQYFISGYVTEASNVILPPSARAWLAELTQTGQTSHAFTVTYSDDLAVDVATIDSNDIRITGPNGYDQLARFLSVDAPTDGTPRTVTYAADSPTGEVWSPTHNGTYLVSIRSEQVSDTQGAWVAAGQLGQFNVAVPSTLYFANLDADPSWTLEPQWQYGAPSYASGGPVSGYTGSRIIGYNLGGDYANNLADKYATTPPINTSGSTSLTLRFQRWLRVKQNDVASIQVSTDGNNWIHVWSSSSAVSDSSWQEVQYTLPPGIAGSSAVRLRWGLASNVAQQEIGWNLDDVELLGDGAIDPDTPGQLEVSPAEGLDSSGYLGNRFTPSSITYTLVNNGGTTLDWTASKIAAWLDLSTDGGTLDPGDSTTLTVSVNANADSLDIGNYADAVKVASSELGGAAYSLPMTLEVATPLEFIEYSLTQPLVFQMAVEAIPGTDIVIEASAGLLDWTALSTNRVPSDGIVSFTDPVEGLRTRWYRARAMP